MKLGLGNMGHLVTKYNPDLGAGFRSVSIDVTNRQEVRAIFWKNPDDRNCEISHEPGLLGHSAGVPNSLPHAQGNRRRGSYTVRP